MSRVKAGDLKPGTWVRIQRHGRLEIAEVFDTHKGTDGKTVVVSYGHGSFSADRVLEARNPIGENGADA